MPLKRTLKTRKSVTLQADTEDELNEAVEHYRARGYDLWAQRRDGSGSFIATMGEARHASA